MANIAIVGGGASGLAAGIYAQMNGHHATIYERHFKVGGNLTGWDRKGYHIDNCIHWLTGTNPLTKLNRMWNELGALGEGVEVYHSNSLYTFEKDGQSITLTPDLEQVKREMIKISPEDEKEILSFVRAVRGMQYLNGIAGENHDKKSSLWQKVIGLPSVLKYRKLSIEEFALRFKHPLLQGFFKSIMTQHYGAFALVMIFATYTSRNGGIPIGTSCVTADRLAQRFLSLGGTLRLRAGVKKINVNGRSAKSITLDDGTTVDVDYVILATDPSAVFGSALDESYMPKRFKKQIARPDRWRFSSFHCAFACDSDAVPFDSEVILEIPEQYKRGICAEYVAVREFGYEKSFSPEGKNIIQTMVYCLDDEAKAFIELYKDKEAYKQRKDQIVSDTVKILTERYPDLEGKLECIDVWTPATYCRYTGSEVGAWMGFILPAGEIPLQMSRRIKGLKNVYLGTQWQQNPGGLPMAILAGKNAVRAIPKK